MKFDDIVLGSKDLIQNFIDRKPNGIVIIWGATATGKSKLSVKLADFFDVEIISSDSRQIFKDMNIGTDKVSHEILKRIPHHQINIIGPEESYTAGQWQKDVKKQIKEIQSRGKLPMIVGGTGLYIDTIYKNFEMPEIGPDFEFRKKMFDLEDKDPGFLHRELEKIDPDEAKKIHPKSTRYLVRALEIFHTSGKTKTESFLEKDVDQPILMIGIWREKEQTNELINTRIREMIKNGLVGEVQGLLDKGYSPTLQSMQGIGYKEVVGYLEGKYDIMEMENLLWGNGLISISIVILVELYSQKLSESLEYVINVSQSLNEVLGESTEMLEILNTPHEIQDNTNKKLKIGDGRIDFKNVKFAYDNGEYIFDGLNLKVKPGEKIALVGQSGSGKSTLTKLLFRFYDIQGGIIKIDDQDISQVTQESLRNEISIVPQDVVLFHRSIKENICYGNPTATEEEMIAACKMARCHEFIIKLENGYDTLVGERGIKLSGGERQRVAIARAILENKKILVMDEATSSLDSESEKCIQDAMDEVMKNKTCIVIAHRLSTIKEMDRIIFIENGKIVEEGSHGTLINIKRGKYKKLWNLQLGGFLK